MNRRKYIRKKNHNVAKTAQTSCIQINYQFKLIF